MNEELLRYQRAVGGLDDRTPALMFPLRLETRFGAPGQMWVRVYPDDCLIDSFQPVPSQTEIDSTQRYWIAMWKARGVEAQERGAWRALVASHGSGRAAWLVAGYQPLNPQDEPGDPDVLALIIPTDAPPGDAEAAALRQFWAASWQAGDDGDAAAKALRAFRRAIGDADRAKALLEKYRPDNFSDEPPAGTAREDAQVAVSFLLFPAPDDVEVKKRSWNTQATVRLLPERLVLIGWKNGARVLEQVGAPIPWPLPVGPDPEADAAHQLQLVNGELTMPDNLRWLTEFGRAVDIGMGFRVDLTEQMAGGFDQLMVAGLRADLDAAHGKQLLQELLAHHRDGTSGFAVLRQGTPTNNTEEQGSGFTRSDDADRSFDQRQNPGDPLRAGTAWNAKRDGEWLAEALGIDYSVLDPVQGSRNTDQLEAQAMNVALWPATLGYSLETMLHPVLDDADIAGVRWFAERFVTGRGLLPAIRLGRQPYGVLPATALSRLGWIDQEPPPIPVAGMNTPPGAQRLLAQLHRVTSVMATDWTAMSTNVQRVGGPTADPQQTLLDVLGLLASSADFGQRFAESVEDLYNRMRFYGWAGQLIAALVALGYELTGMQLLRRLGYAGTDVPDELHRLFLDQPNPLTGPVVDEAPLSETAVLAAVSGPVNYIQWLRTAAASSLDQVRQEQGFNANQPPRALLYLLLRQALLLSYWSSGLQLSLNVGVLDTPRVKAARRESPFVHIAQGAGASESRWQILYQQDPRLTQNQPVTVGQYLTSVIGLNPATSDLQRMLAALDVLAPLPTARLERLFAEHLDLCSYRLDAWQQGLVQYGLALSRYVANNDTGRRTGIYLGAFGWLEDVRPRPRTLTPVGPVAGVDPSFFDPKLPPLVRDSTNGGYIQAPSLNQAVAAAVLRNGYLANAGSSNPGSFAVDLSSRRVRVALSLLEGIRQGQSLGALLGYQLERSLHDAYGFAEVDEFIYALRGKFPLAAGRSTDTAAPDAAIETVEAKNVVDGLQLVNHVKGPGGPKYPFGFTDLPAATDAQQTQLTAAVDRLLDSADAVADVTIAEGVFNAVLNNYDAAAAALDASAQGQLPPEPRVVQTPRSGRTVTHRVAIHLESGLDEAHSPIAGLEVTPRARLEPAVNKWLAGLLPAPDGVGCTVRWLDPAGGALQTLVVTQKDLKLQPIDMLYVASLDTSQALTEMDGRVLLFAQSGPVPRPDCAVTIQYQAPIAGKVTFADVAPMIRQLKPLVLHSRALRTTDAAAQGAAPKEMDANVSVKAARVTQVRDDMRTLHDDLVAFRDELAPLHEPSADLPEILDGLDDRLESLADPLLRASSFGLPGSDWSFITSFRSDWFTSVLGAARKLGDRFAARLADADAQLAAYDAAQAGMTNSERFAALIPIERRVRASITIPQPANPVAYRAAIGVSRGRFAARLTAIRAMLSSVTKRTADARAAIQALLAGPPRIEDLDTEPADPVLAVLDKLADRFASRLDDADAKLADYDATQAGMTDEERFAALGTAELFVRAELTDPQPASPAAYRAAIGAARGIFAARLTAIRNVLDAPPADRWTAFLGILDGPPPISDLDPQKVELPQFEDACVRASADLLARARSLITLIEERCLQPAAALIQQAAASASPADAAKLLIDASKKLLGEDAILLPEFALAGNAGAAFQAAFNAAQAGDPLKWQTTVAKTPQPMDTWLYGVARVRERMRQWEAVSVYAEAFGGAASQLLPVQVPWNAGEHWLGLEYAPGFSPVGERLCYTASFVTPFDPARPQCGLKIDDWTEIIPATRETTGIAFHYDRPNAEAPQALLLLTPPRFTGAWRWDDVVDGVRETFERAKSRAVEPAHVAQSPYARFLPMTVMAATLHQVSIMTNLARNNRFDAIAMAGNNA